MKRIPPAMLLLVMLQLAAPDAARPQDASPVTSSPRKWEIGLLGSGGAVLNDNGKDIQLWTVGLRVGRILRGELSNKSFRYETEVHPAFAVLQRPTVYGVEVIPVLLNWNFGSGNTIHPYFEVGAGLLFSRTEVPPDTSRFNFTPQARFGFEFPIQGSSGITLGLQVVHISNADLAPRNRGYDTVQLHVGWSWYR